MPFTEPEIAHAAARAFAERRRFAQELLRDGRVTIAQVQAKLRPWAAIALLAGADVSDVPELFEALVEKRTEQLDDPARGLADARARALLADELSRPAEWKAELTRARDAALLAVRDSQDARDLVLLARHFCPALPWTPREPDPERTAA